MICRLGKDYFDLSTDLFIVNAYIKLYNSSSCTKDNNGLYTILEQWRLPKTIFVNTVKVYSMATSILESVLSLV